MLLSNYLEANGQKIHYLHNFERAASDAPVLLLLHGFLLDSTMFSPLMQALGNEFRLVAFDARALGKTQWDGKAFSLYDTVADCIALMDALQIEKAIISGMSQGGYAALRLALRHPARVSGLVLMSTRSGADEEPTKAAYREVRDTWKNVGAVEPMLKGLMGAIIGAEDDPKIAPYWAQWFPIWQNYKGDNIFHGMNNLLERDEITPLLGQIQQPALVLHGKEDSGVPFQLGEQLHQDLPNSQGFILTEGAHACVLTHVESYVEPIRNFVRQFAKG
ncbi:alpha/beta fold hydrolase [Hugenholtzia roseola]|uniref:alpha/beta fold hydrolase n=1 Tax=Hugenholtzia roseola TaxID=1002 RepID=UPI0004079EF0|nr:alpha/beta hydrolase [Hugenholtzia roseola]